MSISIMEKQFISFSHDQPDTEYTQETVHMYKFIVIYCD